MSTEQLTDALRETLDLFAAPGAPQTTNEVASRLDLGRRSTYERLERLTALGELETKKVGASARVWWRPPSTDPPSTDGPNPVVDRRPVESDDPDPTRSDGDLATTDAQFRSLVEATDEYAIFLIDAAGRVRTWNRGAARIKGYERSGVLGRHFSTFYTEADRAAGVPAENLADAAENGSVRAEGWRVRADGSRFWAHVTITPIRDEDGDVDGFAKVTRDMTDQRERERAIRRERDLLERVQQTSPIGIGIYDANGEPRRVNCRFAELLGRDGSESSEYRLGHHPLRDVEGEPIPIPERPAMRALSTGESVLDERVRVDGLDGRTRWLSVNAAPLAAGDDGVVVTMTDVTRLQSQARRLERQRDGLEHELAHVFERVDDGFFALDEDLRFTHVNDWAVTLLDVDESAVLGAYIWDVLESGPAARRTFEECLRTQEQGSFDEYYEPLEAWFETQVYPSDTGLSVYFRDVTERKEREYELERYAGLVDAVGDPVYELDASGRFTFVNDAMVRDSGYEESELLGRHVSVGMDEEAIEAAEAELLALIADGGEGNATLEYEVVRKDGDRIPVENRFCLLTDEDGGIRGSAGSLRDVSHRKERERALEESERRYRTLAENFPNGAVALVDADYNYVTVGGTPLSEVDAAAAELEGVPVHEALPDSLADVLVPSYERALDGESVALERQIGDCAYQFHFVPVCDDDGEVFAAIGTSQDVTDRVERERELERQRERLAALDDLNGVFRDVTDAVIGDSTREEIEASVCEHLADSDSYLFAWTGDVDFASETVTLRSEAGVEGYLDDVTISVDPDDQRSRGPTGRALRTDEVQTTHDVRADDRYDPWREASEERGFRSAAAVPIRFGETVYGVLNVYADRPNGFEGQERAVVGQLGEVVGHAIAATERKRALLTDEVVELEFRMRDLFAALDVGETPAGRVALDDVVPLTDGEYLVYGTATAEAVPGVEHLVEALPHWTGVTFRNDDGDGPTDFELRLAEPPVLSVLASLGGSIAEAVLEDGDYHMRLHLSPSADVRRMIDAVKAAYPTADLLKRRQTTRPGGSTSETRAAPTADLTDRQRTALEAAYHAGFFEWPRDAAGEEVADSLGISAPTFHQHLRKAEKRVFDALLSTPTAT